MRRGLLLLLIVAVLVLPIALALRDFSRVMLIELMRLIWLVRQQLQALPQMTVWGLLLVVVLVAAVGSLFGWSQTPSGIDRGFARVPGQVWELNRWIRHAAEGRYFRWTLNRHMTNLIWEVLAYRERTTPRRLKQRVRAGEIELPPAILAFVESSGPLRPAAPRSLWSLLRRRWPKAAPHSEAKWPRARPALDEVVRFLEEQLEVENDRDAG
jgi:hypothetical protein